MSATWNYAEMSHTAATFGGPEKYIAAIKRAERLPWMVRGIVLGTLAGAGALRLGQVAVERYKQVRAEGAAAEAALLEILDEPEPPGE